MSAIDNGDGKIRRDFSGVNNKKRDDVREKERQRNARRYQNLAALQDADDDWERGMDEVRGKYKLVN